MTAPQYTPIRLAAEFLLDSPTNPRQFYDEAALQELAESIKSQGLIQPIVARPIGKGLTHEIVCGHRRVRAARLAGLEVIDAIVKRMTDDEAATAQIHENLARKDVTPLEEAEGYDRLIRQFKVPIEKVIKDTGKSRSYIYGILSLRKLRKPGQEAVATGLPVGLAQRVATLPTEAIQRKALDDLRRMEWQDGKMVQAGWLSEREGRRALEDTTYFVPIKDITFDLELAGLGGVDEKCSECPKRTANDPACEGVADLCTDVECHGLKLRGHWATKAQALREEGHTVLEGDEAKAFAPHEYSSPRGFERLGQGLFWRDSKLVTVEDAIAELPEGAHPPKVTYVINDDGTLRGYISTEDSNALRQAILGKKDPEAGSDDDDDDDSNGGQAPAQAVLSPVEAATRDNWSDIQRAMMRAAASRPRTTDDLRWIAASILEGCDDVHEGIAEAMGWDMDPAFQACESWGENTRWATEQLANMTAEQLGLLLVLLAIEHGGAGYPPELYRTRAAMAQAYGIDPLNPPALAIKDEAAGQAEDAQADMHEQEQLQLAGLPPKPDDEDAPADAPAPAARGGKNPPVRYRNQATGETWSGRGLQPRWLKAAIAAGNKLSDYAVEAVAA